MQIVSNGDNLHEMSDPVFQSDPNEMSKSVLWVKIRKISKYAVGWKFYQSANH